jgi:hypothetical protein
VPTDFSRRSWRKQEHRAKGKGYDSSGDGELRGYEGLRDRAAQKEILGRHYYGGTEVPPFQSLAVTVNVESIVMDNHPRAYFTLRNSPRRRWANLSPFVLASLANVRKLRL